MSDEKEKKKKIPKFQVSLIAGKCIACGARCESECPADAVSMNDKGEPIIDLSKCIGCLKCAKVCPAEALVRNINPAWEAQVGAEKNLSKVWVKILAFCVSLLAMYRSLNCW